MSCKVSFFASACEEWRVRNDNGGPKMNTQSITILSSSSKNSSTTHTHTHSQTTSTYLLRDIVSDAQRSVSRAWHTAAEQKPGVPRCEVLRLSIRTFLVRPQCWYDIPLYTIFRNTDRTTDNSICISVSSWNTCKNVVCTTKNVGVLEFWWYKR